MTERISVKKCKALLDRLGKLGNFPTDSKYIKGKPGQGGHYQNGFFHIEVAYGHPRLVYIYKNTGESDVSPRLPSSQLYMWLDAAGVAGLKARYKDLKKRE